MNVRKEEIIYQTGEIIELNFYSRSKFGNPYTEVELSVKFISEDGLAIKVRGFWNGGADWVARFTPFKPGKWKWESRSNIAEDTGFNGKTGEFTVTAYEGENAIRKHGFLRIGKGGRAFIHEDGTPFFWLADTAWGASAKAGMAEWEKYLTFRRNQGFNIIQVNALPQFDASGLDHRLPFSVQDARWDLYRLNPEYFGYLDRLVKYAYDAGVLMAMVILHFTCVPATRKDFDLRRVADFTPETAGLLGRYLAARYSAFGILWITSGDSDFIDEKAIAVYDAAAVEVRRNSPYKPLLTAHLFPGCDAGCFRRKKWLDFYMFQSAHIVNSRENALKLAENAGASLRKMPVVNGEPCYEYMGYFGAPGRADRFAVRSTGWFSILGGANAGITYGVHGIWPWHREGEQYEWESTTLLPVDWEKGLLLEGAGDYVRMKGFFEKLNWWELAPLKLEGVNKAEVVAASSETKGNSVIVVYMTGHLEFTIPAGKKDGYDGLWFDPVGGSRLECRMIPENGEIHVDGSPLGGESVLLLISH
jgi:hypothetical protein